MRKYNSNHSRRRLLQSLTGTVVGSIAFVNSTAASGPFVSSGRGGDFEYEQIKGSVPDPISTNRIEGLQRKFTERSRNRADASTAFLDVESTFADQQIVAYNVILGSNGGLREQFVTVGSARSDGTRFATPAAVTEQRHHKADKLLERATSEEVGTTDIGTDTDWDIDWNDWYHEGSTDIYWEPEEKWSYDAKVGNVEFTHDVRRSLEYDRIGARSKIRMEPGRQLCNDGLDDYCTSSIQDGFSNKEATVHHDWDKPVNDVPQNDLIVNTDPEGQISGVTGTRGYSLGLDVAKEPSLSVGFSSSVSFPGAALIDKTSLTTGRSEHALEINSPDDPSAGNNAVFEVGSLAAFEKQCTPSPPFFDVPLLDIEVDLEWGLNVPVVGWGHTESTTKSFQYMTYC